jgi:hypothetical protein
MVQFLPNHELRPRLSLQRPTFPVHSTACNSLHRKLNNQVLVQVASDRKANHEEAVYSLRALETQSRNLLYEWLSDQHIPSPLAKEKLHCSVVCACNQLPPEYIPDRRQIHIAPETYILGTIGPAFALFFECNELDRQWNFAVEHGVDMVYHRFVPHISLSYAVAMGWDYTAVQPPSFRLSFTEEIVSVFNRSYKNN